MAAPAEGRGSPSGLMDPTAQALSQPAEEAVETRAGRRGPDSPRLLSKSPSELFLADRHTTPVGPDLDPDDIAGLERNGHLPSSNDNRPADIHARCNRSFA